MKIAICDDEKAMLEKVAELIDEYKKTRAEADIAVFSDPEELLEAAFKCGGYDIYILDVVMPQMSGIELGMKLRENNYDGKIIYLTASEEFAIDSYKAQAYQYLLKPVDKNALFSALDGAIALQNEKTQRSIIVKTKENSIKINFNSILYTELSKRAIDYHLTNGSVIRCTTIRTGFPEAMAELIRDKRFKLCGKSVCVNMYYISSVESECIVFKDKEKIYLPKKTCSEIRSAWCDFWFGEGDAL